MTDKPTFIPKKDRVFVSPERGARPFRFDDVVADAFDDMARRSIPGYLNSLRTIAWLAEEHVAAAFHTGTVYDLGASTGALEEALLPILAQREAWRVVAVDLSNEMLERAESRLAAQPAAARIEWRAEDVRQTVFEDAIFVVSNYCLQFVDASAREAILARIYEGLRPGGFFVLSEKTIGTPEEEHYYRGRYDAFKRDQGYSEAEITHKRQALEGVLLPWTAQQNENALRAAGFTEPVLMLKHWNFSTWLVRKS